MKLNLNVKSTFFAAIAIASGVVVLLGYFIQFLAGLRLALLQGALALSAVVLLVGIVNLARVHWRRFKTRQKGGVYSLVLLISLILTLVFAGLSIVVWGPGHENSLWLYQYIQLPIESSLMALLAVILVYAVVRMLNRRMNVFSFIFIGTVLIVLISAVSLPFFDMPVVRDKISIAARALASAGARGILLGVALGTVATGLRILMGADRPYGD